MNSYSTRSTVAKSLINAQISRYEEKPFTKGIATIMVITTNERFLEDVRAPLLSDKLFNEVAGSISVQRGNVLVEYIPRAMPMNMLRGSTAILALVGYEVGYIDIEQKKAIELSLSFAKDNGMTARIERF
jgi:hypothetical protein